MMMKLGCLLGFKFWRVWMQKQWWYWGLPFRRACCVWTSTSLFSVSLRKIENINVRQIFFFKSAQYNLSTNAEYDFRGFKVYAIWNNFIMSLMRVAWKQLGHIIQGGTNHSRVVCLVWALWCWNIFDHYMSKITINANYCGHGKLQMLVISVLKLSTS